MLHTACVAGAGNYNKYRVEPSAARVALPPFAVAVHEADGVGAACVALQDRFGLDVDVLLLAAYVGAVRGQTLTAEQVSAARAVIDEWHVEVVRRLRGVRRGLKSGPAPAPSARTEEIRAAVAKAELDAELVELDQLDQWAAGLPADQGSPSAELALAAMEVVVHSYSADAIDDDARGALAAIASAAGASS
jgi:uncharacterized protein (TIGR02444 family)